MSKTWKNWENIVEERLGARSLHYVLVNSPIVAPNNTATTQKKPYIERDLRGAWDCKEKEK